MRNYIIYNGINSSDYGAYIDNKSKDNAPERDVDNVEIPGRNGTLTIDNGKYNNITVPYRVFIRKDFADMIKPLRQVLLKDASYHRLEDTYNPEEFRLAKYSGGITAETSQTRYKGYFDIEFDCMPQRFLKSGEKPIEITSNTSLYNPTEFDAKPLLKIYGTGKLIIEGQSITVSSANDYTIIDCEIMEAYKGDINCNSNVSIPDEVNLYAGTNQITLSGITKVEITPRWWLL